MLMKQIKEYAVHCDRDHECNRVNEKGEEGGVEKWKVLFCLILSK